MKKRRINLIVKEDLHRRLTIHCAQSDQKLQGFLEKLIEEFLNKLAKQ